MALMYVYQVVVSYKTSSFICYSEALEKGQKFKQALKATQGLEAKKAPKVKKALEAQQNLRVLIPKTSRQR